MCSIYHNLCRISSANFWRQRRGINFLIFTILPHKRQFLSFFSFILYEPFFIHIPGYILPICSLFLWITLFSLFLFTPTYSIIIPDTHLCVSVCIVHLHPLLSVFENFPIALKMYFLCSDRFSVSAVATPDKSA